MKIGGGGAIIVRLSLMSARPRSFADLWIPAFAGMTAVESGNDGGNAGMTTEDSGNGRVESGASAIFAISPAGIDTAAAGGV